MALLIRISARLSMAAVAFWLAEPVTAQGTGSEFHVTGIEVIGTSRYTESEVVEASGLSTGQVVTVAELDAAAERMARTGLFNSVRYRYVTNADQMEVTFTVEEAQWGVPVVFDNFIWFEDDELVSAIRQEIPSFDGHASMTHDSVNLVTRLLQQVLESHSIEGRVESGLYTNTMTGDVEHTFSVRDPGLNLRVCALQFEGASDPAERYLLAAVQDAIGDEYSRVRLRSLSSGTLRQVYRQHGYWRAEFDTPSPSLNETPGCDGVTVTIPTNEGEAYAWERADWTGTSAIETENLDRLLGMKPGEVSDASKIEAGMREVESAYGQLGYLLWEGTFEPELDDSSRQAVFHVAITEGPQFRMGTFEVIGLSEARAADLAGQWRLQTGEVYDDSYLTGFVADRIRPLQARGVLPTGESYQQQINQTALLVDVRIRFR